MKRGQTHACKLVSEDGAVCSGTVIDSNAFKTAAHCLRGKSSEMLTILCPDGQKFKAEQVFSHPKYKKSVDKKSVDVGVVTLKTKFKGELPALIMDEDSMLEFLSYRNCAVWAYGPNILSLKKVGKFHGVYIKSYSLDGSVIVLKSPLEFSVQAGDSGGGLYCKDDQSRWVDVGSVYGHDFVDSYIVRNDKVSSFLSQFVKTPSRGSLKPYLGVRSPSKMPLISLGVKYGVRPFSVVQTAVGSKGVGDQQAVNFFVESMNEEFVSGELHILDVSPLRYLCDESILCRGVYKNVSISTERLFEL